MKSRIFLLVIFFVTSFVAQGASLAKPRVDFDGGKCAIGYVLPRQVSSVSLSLYRVDENHKINFLVQKNESINVVAGGFYGLSLRDLDFDDGGYFFEISSPGVLGSAVLNVKTIGKKVEFSLFEAGEVLGEQIGDCFLSISDFR